MTLSKCTPIIPVADLAHAGEWFTRCLGFNAQKAGDTMVHLSRDNVNIRLVQKAADMDMDDPRRQQSIYIDVDDVDAFYAVHKAPLEGEGEGCAPFDRPYGMREMHIIYESLLMFFGSPTPKGSL
jgi:hypothetical protein